MAEASAEPLRTQRELRAVLDVTAPRTEAGEAAARLSALLALRHPVDSAREWRFDVSLVLRFGAVVAVGLSSSLGQVILERVVDPFLP